MLIVDSIYREHFDLTWIIHICFALICCVSISSCRNRHGNVSLEHGTEILHEALEAKLQDHSPFNSEPQDLSENVIVVCREAIQNDNENAFLFCDLGNAYYKLGRYEEALDAAEQGASKGKNLPETYLLSYLAYYKLHRYTKAISALKRYILLSVPTTIESKYVTTRQGFEPFSQYSNIDQAKTEIYTCYMKIGICLFWPGLTLAIGLISGLISIKDRRASGCRPSSIKSISPSIIILIGMPLLAVGVGIISRTSVIDFLCSGLVATWMIASLVISFVVEYVTWKKKSNAQAKV